MVIPVLIDTKIATAMTTSTANAMPNNFSPSKIKLRIRIDGGTRSAGLLFTVTV